MNILQRYVFKELFLPFILSLMVLNFIFMGGYLVKAANFIIGRGVSLGDTATVLLLAMPGIIGYTVPTSILMAVLLVFGNLSQSNELRAMKASGVQLLHVIMPVFLLGLALSCAIFVFNDQVASTARFELRRAMKRMVIKFPKALIEPGRFVKLSDSIIFMTKEMHGDQLRDVVAYEMGKNEDPVRTIIAESGEIATLKDQSAVQIRLFNGSISDAQEEGVHTMQFKTYEFPPLGQEDIDNMQKKKRDLTLAEILLDLEKADNSEDRRILWTAFHERIAFSCGCFLFVIVGVPFAMLVRRGEIVLSFGIAMATASFYYIFFAGAKTLAIRGLMTPVLALWIPNVILFAAGIYLMRRAILN